MVKYFGYVIKGKIKGLFILMVVLTLLSMSIGMVIPYLSGRYLDVLLSKNITDIYNIVKNIVILIASSIVIGYVSNLIMIKLSIKSSFNFTFDIIKHIQKIPLDKLEKFDPLYLSQRISGDVSEIINFYIQNAVPFFTKWIFCIIQLMMVYYINETLFWVTIVCIPVYVLIYVLSKRTIYSKNYIVKEEQNKYYQKQSEQLLYSKIIKKEASFDNSEKIIKKSFNEYFKVYYSLSKFLTVLTSLNNSIMLIFQIVFLVIGVSQFLGNKITIGEIAIVNAYFDIIISQITYYVNVGKSVQSVKVCVSRIDELKSIDIEHNGNIKLKSLEKISLDNLSYKFENKVIFSKIDFTFWKNNIYIVKGNNGKGKSTLINTVLGILQEHRDGNVCYNDVNIENLDLYELRQEQLAIVTQEMDFPNEKVIDFMLKYCELSSSEKLLEYINNSDLKAMYLNNEFQIQSFFDKKINYLSGGELQKICILRALLKKSEIIVMDEPTSKLDRKSIEIFKNIMLREKSDKIIILITHDYDLEEIGDKVLIL